MRDVSEAARAAGEKLIGPRSRRGAITRARLIDAAKVVFEADGFLEARISDIAETAGLSQGSFYHYFESKEEIFREVAANEEDKLSAQSIMDSSLLDESVDMTMRERIRDANSRFLTDYRAGARIMGVIEQVSRYDEHVRAARFARQAHYVTQTEAAISALQRRGRADPVLDPKIAAMALTAMVTRFAEAWFVQGQVSCSLTDGIEQITTLCVNALCLKEDALPPRRSRST